MATSRRWQRGVCAGVALGTLLMLASLPASAQQGPPPRPEPPAMPFPPPGMAGPGMAGPGVGGPGVGGPDPGGRHGGPLSDLARAEADQLASQTIAELAQAPLPDVQRIVRTWGPPTALRYFAVAPKAFHDAMQPRLVALVKAAAHDQLITDADAERIVERLQHDPMRPPPL